MKKVKRVVAMIQYNIWSLVGFECLFKLISFVIFTPFFLKLFDFIMKLMGYKYLTIENIASFLSNPITLFMFFLLLIFMTIYAMFDIITIIVILDASFQKKKINITDAIRISLSKCKRIFYIKNIPFVILMLFFIPFLNIGVSSSFITLIKIPKFVTDFIVKDKVFLLVGMIVILLFFSLVLKWIYSIHYFVMEDCNFKEARKKSSKLSREKHIQDLFTLFLIQFVNALLYFLVLMMGIFIILFFSNLFKNILLLKSLSTTIIWMFIAFSFVVAVVLSPSISYASISVMYYFHKEEKNEEIRFLSFPDKKENNKINHHLKKIFAIISILAILVGTVFTYGVYKGRYNFNIEYVRMLEVTAHRGASVDYPENTMSAFVGAKELGADWIELDVQQTKDKEIIVIHDTNFKRTTGVNKKTWKLNMDEVEKLDAGSFFSEKYKGEKIPLLKDVIAFAKKEHMKLNIELKPTGHETEFEKSVIDIINSFDFKDNCVVASQVYEVLERVKEYDASIRTAYVMSFAYGDIVSLKAADHFSIEESSVTSSLVKQVHKEGKQLYVWTVNTEEDMKKMIDLNVDNIITDNISLAKHTIYSSKTSNIVNEYIKIVEKLF